MGRAIRPEGLLEDPCERELVLDVLTGEAGAVGGGHVGMERGNVVGLATFRLLNQQAIITPPGQCGVLFLAGPLIGIEDPPVRVRAE